MSLRENSSNCEVTAIASWVIGVERSVGFGAKRKPLDGGRPVAEPVHLPACQHEPYRSLELKRAETLPARPGIAGAARTECAAHKLRHHAHIVRLLFEHAAEIALDVLHALRLVIDRELAVAFPHRGRSKQFHRVVVLGRDEIFGLVPDGGRHKGLRGVAVRLVGLRDGKGLIALLVKVGDEGLLFIFDAHERGGVARDLPFLGQYQRDRLPIEFDLSSYSGRNGEPFSGATSSFQALSVPAMRGRFLCVSTSITPSTRSASLESMCAMRPFGIVDSITKPKARPGALNSPAYLASPVTLARPSTREVAVPM